MNYTKPEEYQQAELAVAKESAIHWYRECQQKVRANDLLRQTLFERSSEVQKELNTNRELRQQLSTTQQELDRLLEANRVSQKRVYELELKLFNIKRLVKED